MSEVLVHITGPVVGGIAQFCSRCGIVLLDIYEGYASSPRYRPTSSR